MVTLVMVQEDCVAQQYHALLRNVIKITLWSCLEIIFTIVWPSKLVYSTTGYAWRQINKKIFIWLSCSNFYCLHYAAFSMIFIFKWPVNKLIALKGTWFSSFLFGYYKPCSHKLAFNIVYNHLWIGVPFNFCFENKYMPFWKLLVNCLFCLVDTACDYN
jgi:hypothetical protein